MITAGQISDQLTDSVERVAAYLLTNGKRQGREWCAGSVSNDSGESLKVCLAGTKAGKWSDFATGEGGDLLDLWRAVRNCDLSTAINEAKAWLGIRDVRMETPAKKTYAKPKRSADWKPVNNAAVQWLTEVRKLSPLSIEEFKVEYARGGKLGDCVVFPFYRGQELVAVKYRSFPGKEFTQEAGCEPCLFGWQAMPPDRRAAIITEGELDAMAFHTYGFPALSVDKGGGGGEKQGWIEAEFDRLARFDRLFLALDNDAAGKQATAEIVRRLGAERCFIVTLPRGMKDANQCLMEGVPVEEMAEAIGSAKTCDPPELRDIGHFADEVCKLLEGGDSVGLTLPWRKCGSSLLLRPGETSIMAGRNGHGKSQMAGHILLDAVIRQGSTACVASLEFRTAKWLLRLVKQACGNGEPAEPFARAAMEQLSGKLWSFDMTASINYVHMLEVFRYAARRYRCELFLIDNLAKCGIAEDDYREQHKFIQAVTNFSRDENVHTIIVHHLRKAQNESDTVDKGDIKGSGSLTDLVDTVLTVWRNKAKEAEKKLAEQQKRNPRSDVMAKPDAILACHKQRNGDDEPSFGLWFCRSSYQFLASPHHQARRLFGWSRQGDN